MDCGEYRRSLLADPQQPGAVMRTHAAGCGDCSRFTVQVLQFEDRLRHALQVQIAAVPRMRLRRRGLAIAASLLLAVVGAGSLWLAAPGRSLAADVVQHMSGEPNAWTRTAIPVPGSQLNDVLSASGMHLKSRVGLVSYANSCEFRGRRVPHLVVQTGVGPVTVMVLAREPVRREVRFDEQGYRGIIVPVPGHGSLAVLEQAPNVGGQPLESVAAQVLGAIEWTG